MKPSVGGSLETSKQITTWGPDMEPDRKSGLHGSAIEDVGSPVSSVGSPSPVSSVGSPCSRRHGLHSTIQQKSMVWIDSDRLLFLAL